MTFWISKPQDDSFIKQVIIIIIAIGTVPSASLGRRHQHHEVRQSVNPRGEHLTGVWLGVCGSVVKYSTLKNLIFQKYPQTLHCANFSKMYVPDEIPVLQTQLSLLFVCFAKITKMKLFLHILITQNLPEYTNAPRMPVSQYLLFTVKTPH